MARALVALEANPPKLTKQLNVGHVMVACALGYLDLRFEGAWRKKHPKLRKWLAKFEERVPAFEATRGSRPDQASRPAKKNGGARSTAVHVKSRLSD